MNCCLKDFLTLFYAASGSELLTPPQQNGYNSLKFHATDLKLGSKFSSGRWLHIYEVSKQYLENEKGI